MSNKKIGSDFEKRYAKFLRSKGYWVMLVTPKSYINSQPCDIIATRNNIFYAFECKTLHSNCNKFSISRIEENQRIAYQYMRKKRNG